MGNLTVANLVYEIFDRPAKLTYLQSTDHSTAAFESMETPPDLCQCVGVAGIATPDRKFLIYSFQHLTRFFGKDLDHLRVEG